MKRLYIMAITIALLAMVEPSHLIEASCTGGSLCIGNDILQKGVEEIGKVWYLTVFAGDNPPIIESEVFGIVPNPDGSPQYLRSEAVQGFLSCVQKVCIQNPDKPVCTVPGGNQGQPFQVREAQFFLSSATSECLVKGKRGTCKVTGYDHILLAAMDGNPCPGGFVPDFSPDPFIGRTCTCDASQGELIQDRNGRPICRDGSAATCLCMLVSGLPGTIGEPYANQAEIIDDGGTIFREDYDALACTPNTFR